MGETEQALTASAAPHVHRRWVPSRNARSITSLRLANEITDPVLHGEAIDRHFAEFFDDQGTGASCPVRGR